MNKRRRYKAKRRRVAMRANDKLFQDIRARWTAKHDAAVMRVSVIMPDWKCRVEL